MANFNCPLCGKPLARRKKKDGSSYFWGCTGFRDGCKFIANDWNDEPFIKKCVECGAFISKNVSKKTGKPFTACTNKEGHASGQWIFYNDDGSPQTKEEKPEAKAEFTCPECGKVIEYRKSKKSGNNYFACFNKEAHADGQVKFWEDNNGYAVM